MEQIGGLQEHGNDGAGAHELSAFEADALARHDRGYGHAGSDDCAGIPGGVGGGDGYAGRVTFYVGVPDVEAALRKAERIFARCSIPL